MKGKEALRAAKRRIATLEQECEVAQTALKESETRRREAEQVARDRERLAAEVTRLRQQVTESTSETVEKLRDQVETLRAALQQKAKYVEKVRRSWDKLADRYITVTGGNEEAVDAFVSILAGEPVTALSHTKYKGPGARLVEATRRAKARRGAV